MMVLTGIHIFILRGPPQKKYTPVNWGVNKHLLYFNDILYHKIDLCVCVGGWLPDYDWLSVIPSRDSELNLRAHMWIPQKLLDVLFWAASVRKGHE